MPSRPFRTDPALRITYTAHHPEVGDTYLGRWLAVAQSQDTLWIACQVDMQGANPLAVWRVTSPTGQALPAPLLIDAGGHCHQPCLAPVGERGVALVWNQADQAGWSVRHACISDGLHATPIELVSRNATLCLPPATATSGDVLWVAWGALAQGHVRVHLAKRTAHGWEELGPVSSPGVDAYRPSLAVQGEQVYQAWDQYVEGRYEVVLAVTLGHHTRILATLGCAAERWFCPKLIAAPDGAVYLTWVVLQEVTDDLGIIEHVPSAMVARWSAGQLQLLGDASNRDEPRAVADLREGLLAHEIYSSYFGLRRAPRLLIHRGQVWCLWEARREAERSGSSGYLVGRRLLSDDTWAATEILASGQYGYAVPGHATGEGIPVAHLAFHTRGLEGVKACTVQPTGSPWQSDTGRFQRWRRLSTVPAVKPTHSVYIENTEYHIYWADTHCHSNYSPDAEGEVDEIIHYGRDVAGLDAMCVLDNDCYPPKALTQAEWRVHLAYAQHYTQPGRFVLFPGWEYTYHREDLTPDFNHRAVLYPRLGPLHRRIDADADTDDKLFTLLRGGAAMAYPHHCTWQIVDPAVDWSVEVCSSWRRCIEETGFVWSRLAAGDRFGFLGSSDSHRAVPGLGGALTCLYATALSPEALFDAYRQRRTMATQGFFAFVDFRVEGAFMGRETQCSSRPIVEARVEAPDEIEYVQVVRDGAPVHCVYPASPVCAFTWRDTDVAPGMHYYVLRLKLMGDPSFNTDPCENSVKPFAVSGRYPWNLARARGVFAWTSPIWVQVGV